MSVFSTFCKSAARVGSSLDTMTARVTASRAAGVAKQQAMGAMSMARRVWGSPLGRAGIYAGGIFGAGVVAGRMSAGRRVVYSVLSADRRSRY
jgi:hypothetical protein